MIDAAVDIFRTLAPAGVDLWSLRVVHRNDEILSVRRGVPEPVYLAEDCGAMVTIVAGGGIGYAATSELTQAGLKDAIDRAVGFARLCARRGVTDFSAIDYPHPVGEYVGPEAEPWDAVSLKGKFDRLRKASSKIPVSDEIVDWEASFWRTFVRQRLVTSGGGDVRQQFSYLAPSLSATANRGTDTQSRSLGSLRGCCSQGGMEGLKRCEFTRAGPQLAEEALALLDADDCPAGTMDVLLAPDQMMLQIHESVGHPLELDRILGDERNYAGTSFVTPDMFGSYAYGSELLNVSYDPSRPHQFATFGWDDEGVPAKKELVIEKGILQRGLGSATSQYRTGLDGVAAGRACSWNRPPIDRMANLNVEPGDSTLADMIASVERGVYMQTNRSWSIDDSRNKFQFGCEYGTLIEDGTLTRAVKNPNYRGVSATFWRSLKAVGVKETMGVFGTPYCGKGEPNQVIHVGHASPACLFGNVDVFGGAG